MSFPLTVVSGGTGYVGRFIVDGLIEAGHRVRIIGRRMPAPGTFVGPVEFAAGSLADDIDWSAAFAEADNFVHCAFDHVPGRYRHGEGDDPERFKRCNIDGSNALFKAAKAAGVSRAVFLSTRAVYGTQPPGKLLDEDTRPHPDTLYGEVKLAGERRLQALGEPERFCPVFLRVTGVYGSPARGGADKWNALLRAWLAGQAIEPRGGTEVHGRDVAAAVEMMLTLPEKDVFGQVFNVSDLVVDRSDILAIAQEVTGLPHPLPPAAEMGGFNPMSSEKLQALGWKPGGRRLLAESVRNLVERVRSTGD